MTTKQGFYAFLASLAVVVLTAYWWFHDNPHPSFALWTLHALLGAGCVTIGLATLLSFLIGRSKC